MRGDDDDAGERTRIDLAPGGSANVLLTTGSYGHVVDLAGHVVAEDRQIAPMTAAPTMQASPPETTENSTLVSVATAPDSMSPTRGPPCTTAI